MKGLVFLAAVCTWEVEALPVLVRSLRPISIGSWKWPRSRGVRQDGMVLGR
jgi:hypothetical protein